ncbi:MAG: hypothetical protein ABEK50_04825 [bacterium]
MSSLFEPWIRNLVLLVHTGTAFFWLGWMGFIFFILFPVLKRTVPEQFDKIRSSIQQRTRSFVFWMIIIIIATGIYNMASIGLLDVKRLFYTSYGHRFLIKLGAAFTLFGVYFLAPVLMNHGSSAEGCDHSDGASPALGIILHVIAFGAGITAAYIGIGLT